MKNIMVDIETLGTMPGSVVLSVGAVAFDREGLGAEIEVYFDLADSLLNGFRIDASTLRWWQTQDPALFREQTELHPLPAAGLIRLRDFFGDVRATADSPDIRVWANSPSFDLALLREYFSRYNMKLPWHHREEADLRTLGNVLGMDRYVFDGTERQHNGLDDARAQARAAIQMLDTLR